MDSQKEVLSLHMGATESSKYWISVMNELKTRGVQTILIFCTDNLKGIDDALNPSYGLGVLC